MRAYAGAAKASPEAGSSFLVQRCSCGSAGHTGEMCEDCETEKGGIGLQAKLIVGGADDPLEREADDAARGVMGAEAPAVTAGPVARISRSAEAGATGGHSAPASVSRVISGPGEPLRSIDRTFFERRFGHDFGAVRIHRDAAAAASAQDVAARAYTVGSHLVFGTGSYAPDSRGGRGLMAHELAHVIQQTGAVLRHSLAPMVSGGPVGEDLEEETAPEPEVEEEPEGGLEGVVQRFPGGEMFGDDPYDPWPEKTEAARIRAQMAAAQECLKTVPPDPAERDPNRTLGWADFSGAVPGSSPFGAACYSTLKKRTTNTALLKCMPFTGAAEKANPAGIQAVFDPTKSWVKPRSLRPTDMAVNGCQAVINQCRTDIAGGGTWALNTGPNAQCAASPSPRGDSATKPDECETVVGKDCADQATADSARLLAHEQGHYNLTFALAKKANKMITKTTDVDKLLTAANAVRVTQQALYDGQTGHGCNASSQASWEAAIAGELPAVTIDVP